MPEVIDLVTEHEDTRGDVERAQDEILEYSWLRFWFSPRRWSEFPDTMFPFEWVEFRFSREETANIPETMGVYSFVIKPGVGEHNACYLAYVGKTDRTLKKRYIEYLSEQEGKRKSRPKIRRLLTKFKDHLFFVCSSLPEDVVPNEAEEALLAALLPPCNDRTKLPAEVREIVGAFR